MQENERGDIRERVAREREAHDGDDVLGNSVRLKNLFRHINTCAAALRFEQDYKACLSNVKNKWVLDLGCGYGEQSLALLDAGAYVRGIDISTNYIQACEVEAKVAGFDNERYAFYVMDAHSLDFADQTFDLVVGRGILHHLDIQVSLNEIKRVLKVGGRALFYEPLAENPMLKLFRWLTPRARTQDEKPITRENLEMISENWRVESSYYGLISAPIAMGTSIILRPFDNNLLLRMADKLERRLNTKTRWQAYNQYVLLNLVRE